MIWCVEDDPSILDIETYALESAGFLVRGFPDGITFQKALEQEQPRLILLDVMLPGPDGLEILSWLRSTPAYKDIPVIMATAKGSESDRISGLDQGADDYLVKPFSILEMISRVKAVLRRSPPPAPLQYRVGSLELDTKSHTVTAMGERITLTLKEFQLLQALISQPDTVLRREQLYSLVWGSDFIGESRTVDMHIRTLRQKLGAYGELIQTVRGIGYILQTPQ